MERSLRLLGSGREQGIGDRFLLLLLLLMMMVLPELVSRPLLKLAVPTVRIL